MKNAMPEKAVEACFVAAKWQRGDWIESPSLTSTRSCEITQWLKIKHARKAHRESLQGCHWEITNSHGIYQTILERKMGFKIKTVIVIIQHRANLTKKNQFVK